MTPHWFKDGLTQLICGKFVDFYTYNERIAERIGSLLKKIPRAESRIDTTETDCIPLYCFYRIPRRKIPFPEINRLVGTDGEAEIRFSGGYEIRAHKNGKFIKVVQSFSEKRIHQE